VIWGTTITAKRRVAGLVPISGIFLQQHNALAANTYVERAGRARVACAGRLPAAVDSGAFVTLFAGQAGIPNRQRASQVAGFVAAAVAAAALINWWIPLPWPSSWGADFVAVKPTMALCLVALGLALACRGNARLAFAVGLAVAIVAVFDLLDRFGIDAGLDRLNRALAPQAAAPGPGGSFRVINGVPVALALAGVSLALSRFERYHLAATALAGLAGVMQIFALLSHLGGINIFYASVGTPAPLTAAGLLCVAIAILLRLGAMPALRKPRPLWHLLTLLGGAIIAPLLMFGVYTGIRITDAQLRQVRNELTSDARILSANVDREIIGEIERLRALAASASLRQSDFAEFHRQAETSLAWRQNGDIVLIDRNMQELVNTWTPFGTPLGKAAIPEAFVERSLATGMPQVSGLFIGSATKRLMFSIVVPVRIDGENRYALSRSPDLDALAGLVAANELPPDWQAAVSDAAHRFIARSDRQDARIGAELPRAQQHRAGAGGISEWVDSQGRPSLEAYAWSELTGWETAVWAPTALLEGPVRMLWWTIGLTALAAIALVVALASWLGRLIARSVGYAARAATTLGKGDPLPSAETPIVEIDTLMAELRGAAAKRQAAERDLQASRDRLQLAFEATRLGWWEYDPRRHLALWDRRCQEIVDVPKDVAPFEDLLGRVHPDDRERFLAARGASLDPTDPRPYASEYRIIRRDGTVRWVESHGLAYFEGAGPERRIASFVGAMQDITDRKEREEKEHLLMREINHRAKNMLSVVASIAQQTASRNPGDFVERFAERIQALSANQDLLVRNEWSGVEIADLVRAQLAHFADLIGSRISVNGPALRLTPAAAQAIGLALHELATNAGKYGALSNDHGRVDIVWGTAGDTFTMGWTERDGPPVSAPQQRGFGSTVIEAMTERSVAGEVHLDFLPSGVSWRLTCQASNVLEPEKPAAAETFG
jgi:PAS domain S-box-containing protein